MRTKKSLLAGMALAVTMALAACAPGTPAAPSGGSGSGDAGGSTEPIKVGIIYSETGPLGEYGKTYRRGLEAGLKYATDGTSEVNGRPLQVTFLDDGGDADKAVTHAKDQIGQGAKIIGGTVVSGIALKLAEQAEQNKVLYISGPAATDAIQGVNDYTFRSGRQSLQDVATAGTFTEPDGKIVVFAQDTAFGQGNVQAVEAVLGAQGAEVQPILVPEDATEFTPFARQIIDANADMVFVAWAGATSGAMWQGLSQQGVLDQTTVVTGLGDRSTFGAYGAASDKIDFLNHYFPGCCDNPVNKAMVDEIEAAGGTPDLFSPDGFVAGQMIVHAAEQGDDADAMVSALEGWSFEGPKGSYTIRESDHALLQPMFQAKLVQDGDSWKPELVETVSAEDAAPPEKKQ
ncbi:substrate-binding domain-containing protein [Granulicoccus sp. GXG6511]|uniref:substrate-binding domain-containing protein n=1 Tax=Granulicoccus sp. GXG6511 TaxID=3381351 RepID=UPI003D7CA5B1